MFLFAHKTKTPLSTYADSYRHPATIKQDYKDPPLWAWEENKFITKGLRKPMVECHVDQQSLEKVVKNAVEDYTHKPPVTGKPYLPQKYWIPEAEAEKYKPNFISGDRYATGKTGPYNAGWNKYPTCLPRLPKESGMEPVTPGTPVDGPPKSEHFNNYEREVMVNMLNSLTRKQLPSIQPRNIRSIPPLNHRPGMKCMISNLPPRLYDFANVKWNSSHFKFIGGPQRNHFVIHPEFMSENCSVYRSCQAMIRAKDEVVK
ncbi:spermatid-specific manchette-related protein 1 isoform X1 [Antechinus flavipes]|uniref:spermatid-specific manchette-related protein 1 isoform X1 n=1 Tax=Antechinus flavipes TaxID=38775 RepID=UPI002235BC04|nr:spermatid-specific manchette-related protein 1 isoform X1 [Antechinus flavipes]